MVLFFGGGILQDSYCCITINMSKKVELCLIYLDLINIVFYLYLNHQTVANNEPHLDRTDDLTPNKNKFSTKMQRI